MRIVRHNAYVSQRKKRARIFALIGFLLLSGSLLIAWYPDYLMIAYVAMLGGFVLFNMGMQQVGKWTRNPRNDQIMDVRMQGLSDRITLVHYAQLGKHNIEHIAVHPGGLVVFTAREIDGKIEKHRGRWKRKGGLFRRLFSFSGPQLGNPTYETDQDVKRVEEWLAGQDLAVDVHGAIVFLHPSTELDIEDPDYPVLHGEELGDFMRDLPADPAFETSDRDRIVELLAAGESVEKDVVQKPGTRRPRPVKRVAAPKVKSKA